MDAEIERLLKKRQNGFLTDDEKIRLQELIDTRHAIEVKYNLTPADTDGFATIEKKVEWGLFSVFCLGDRAEGIDEIGFQYPLSNAALTPEFPLGVSNHIMEPKATITVRKGALVVGWQLPPLS